MQNSKKCITPFRHGEHLSKYQCPKTIEKKEQTRKVPYASIVGSLMYAMLCTEPDICHSMGLVSRYQSNTCSNHWTVVKCILKYLRSTRDGVSWIRTHIRRGWNPRGSPAHTWKESPYPHRETTLTSGKVAHTSRMRWRI